MATFDDDADKKQPFFRFYGILPSLDDKNHFVSQKKNQEYYIYASNFQLKQFSLAQNLFIDATFKISPYGFEQILNFLVFNEYINQYISVCHVIMTHKSQLLYAAVFNSISSLLKSNNLELETKYVMCDFEMGMRNAMSNLKEDVQIEGCFFHFVKALWHKAGKLGLKNKKNIIDAKIIIMYFKILAHLPIQKRSHLFEELKFKFKEKEKSFDTFFCYFKKYWLLTYEIPIDKLKKNLCLFRTNNACEAFHGKLLRYFGIKKARLSVVISKLSELEFLQRKKCTEYFSQNQRETATSHELFPSIEKMFPITKMNLLINEILEKLKSGKITCETIEKENDLYNQLLDLNNEIYDFVFMKELKKDINDNDDTSNVDSLNQNSLEIGNANENFLEDTLESINEKHIQMRNNVHVEEDEKKLVEPRNNNENKKDFEKIFNDDLEGLKIKKSLKTKVLNNSEEEEKNGFETEKKRTLT